MERIKAELELGKNIGKDDIKFLLKEIESLKRQKKEYENKEPFTLMYNLSQHASDNVSNKMKDLFENWLIPQRLIDMAYHTSLSIEQIGKAMSVMKE